MDFCFNTRRPRRCTISESRRAGQRRCVAQHGPRGHNPSWGVEGAFSGRLGSLLKPFWASSELLGRLGALLVV
eukprot:7968729-Pyramimonas_sp.AAC.1